MDKNFVKTFITGGIILGVANSLYSMLLYVLEVNLFNFGVIAVNFLLTAALIIIPQIAIGRKYRQTYTDGYMDYGSAIKLALPAVVVGGLIVAVYALIFSAIVSPDYMDGMINDFMTKLSENPAMDDKALDEIYAKFEEAKNASLAEKTVQAFTSYAISGVIFSLIAAIFVKRKKDILTD